MISKARFAFAVLLAWILAMAMSGIVTYKAPAKKKDRIESRIEVLATVKIENKENLTPNEERIIKERNYRHLKDQAVGLLRESKSDQALVCLEAMRSRSEGDAQLDYLFARAYQLKNDGESAKGYYQLVLEKSDKIIELAAAIDYMSQGAKKPYIEAVREFVSSQRDSARLGKILESDPYAGVVVHDRDKVFVLRLAVIAMEGKQEEMVRTLNLGLRNHLESELLKPYQMVQNGKIHIDIIRLNNDLVGADNPQKKEISKQDLKAIVDIAKI